MDKGKELRRFAGKNAWLFIAMLAGLLLMTLGNAAGGVLIPLLRRAGKKAG